MNVLRPPLPGPNRGLFNMAMGPLQRQLRSGEYSIFKWASMFESDFVQVSKRGGALDVHNQVRLVRAAVAATTPGLQVPDVLLLARPLFPPEQQLPPHQPMFHHTTPNTRFELTRLLPLCFVKISIHNLEKQQLRFKMATGRTFYLQLCPPLDSQAASFDLWVKVMHLLRPASDLNLAKKEPPGDQGKPGESALPTAESPEGRGCTVAEVPSVLKEEVQEDKKNPAESPYSIPSQEGQTEVESPLASEGPAPDELLLPSKGSQKGRSKEQSSTGRKSSTRSRSCKSHRSQSSKRAASRSQLSSLFMGSFSSSRHKHSKESTKGKERKR